jgi:hypothetical protein
MENFPSNNTVSKRKEIKLAIIRSLEEVKLERDSTHTEVDATYSIVQANGVKYLQIDTYGSSNRQFEGKKSQSIRLSPEVIEQIIQIINRHNL